MCEEYPVYIAERLGIDLGYKIYPEGNPDNLIDGFFSGLFLRDECSRKRNRP